MSKVQIEYFKNLDGLRFLCFLSVFSVHTLHVDNAELQKSFTYNLIVRGLLINAGVGVNFFFVLSGFLITYLLIQEKQNSGTINILHFWFKRVIRIWPLYFVCVFFGFVLFPFIKHHLGQTVDGAPDLKLYLSFLVNFDVLRNGWPDSTELGVLWSVSIEEQFYLVWPILLYFLPVKRYWIVFLVIVAVSLVFRAYNDDQTIYYYHTLSCISDMAVGGAGAWLLLFVPFKDFVVHLKKSWIVILYVLFALCFVFKVQIFNHFLMTRIVERLILSILMLFILLEQNYSLHSFYKMSNFKRISRLGLTTYGMYMLHIIAYLVVITLFKMLKISNNIYCLILLAPLVGLILTIYMSDISFKYFEVKFLRLRKYIHSPTTKRRLN